MLRLFSPRELAKCGGSFLKLLLFNR